MTRRERPVDWAAIREKVARGAAAAERSPSEARELMDQRARALAAPPPSPRAATEFELETLVFVVGPERYAIELCHVREVAGLSGLAPVPGAPEYVAGVATLRGEIVAVVDLRRFLGLSAGRPADRSRAIVLGASRAEFGLLADEAQAIARIPVGELRDPPGASGAGARHVRGIAPGAVIVLDGGSLLADPRLYVDGNGAKEGG